MIPVVVIPAREPARNRRIEVSDEGVGIKNCKD